MPCRFPVRAATLLAGCSVFFSSPSARAAEEKARSVTYPVADLAMPVSDANVGRANGSAKGGKPGDLQTTLRKPRELQVVVDVRLVSVSETLFERLGLDKGLGVDWIDLPYLPPEAVKPAPETGAAPGRQREDVTSQNTGVTFLTQRQASRLVEAVQSDPRSNTLLAPRLTVLNGQQGNLEVTDTTYYKTKIAKVRIGDQVILVPNQQPFKTGFCWTARPVVSADRHYVQLALKITQTDLKSPNVPLIPVQIPVPPGAECPEQVKKGDSPAVFQTFLQFPQFNTQTIATNVTIPDGGTAVFRGLKRMTEVRTEVTPPLVSKIPYLNRCFRSIGYGCEAETLLVLVTPRIIVSEKTEEPVFLGKMPSARPPGRDMAKQALPSCAAAASTGLAQVGWESAPVTIQEPKTSASCPKGPERQTLVPCEPARWMCWPNCCARMTKPAPRAVPMRRIDSGGQL